MSRLKKTTFNDLKRMDKPLLFITIAILIFGLINVLNASSRETVVHYGYSFYYYFLLHFGWIIGSLFVGFYIINKPTKKYYKIMPILFFIVIGLLVYVLIYGSVTRGSTSWLHIAQFGVQPSEFIKPLMIIMLALLFERFNSRLKESDNKKNIVPIVIIFGLGMLVAGLIFLQNDLGTTFIALMIFVVMFWFSPIKLREKLIIMGSSIILIGALLGIVYLKKGYILNDAQKERFLQYDKPCDNYINGGYQVCNGYIAINNGHLFGLGMGHSKQKYSYIPDPHTDFVFAIIVEEEGLVGGTIILILYGIILARIIKIGINSSTTRGRYICIGIAFYMFIHIFINLGGLLGIIPLTGVPLPLLSYGGSFMLSLMCSLAVVQRIKIESEIDKNMIK